MIRKCSKCQRDVQVPDWLTRFEKCEDCLPAPDLTFAGKDPSWRHNNSPDLDNVVRAMEEDR